VIRSIKFNFLRGVFSILLSIQQTRAWAIGRLRSWAPSMVTVTWVLWDLQDRLSQLTGYPICEYCKWVEFPEDNPHDYCKEQIQKAFDENVAFSDPDTWYDVYYEDEYDYPEEDEAFAYN